jgi:predicted O-methyltransferase YrrM
VLTHDRVPRQRCVRPGRASVNHGHHGACSTCRTDRGFPGTTLARACERRRGGWAITDVDAAALARRNHDYVEAWLAEDEVVQAARRRGAELGAVPIGAGGGAALRFLAASLGARAVVEVGTGAGVSGIWLLRGMVPDGVLTTIDLEVEHQRVARESYAEAGIAASRTRVIAGRALDVLPRLTDGAYDLVFCDGAKSEYPDYLREALRLLRPGGVVAFDNALWRGRVPDPSARDPETVAIRELLKAMRDDERLVPVLLPVGDGLAAAVVRA